MKQVKTDIVVIAGGTAGLAAAVAAAEKGASVIVLEKNATTGGTGNMGMGPLGVESRIQKQKLIGPAKDEAFKAFMDYIHWRGDARLVRTYLNKSGDTIDWLQDMGVQFWDVAAYFRGGNQTWHIVKPDKGEPGPGASATMIRIMTERAKKLGVNILLNTPAAKIIKKNNMIAGAIAQDASGDAVEVTAKAVVIATGGFGDSPELIRKNTGYTWGKDMFSFKVPGLTGDGIRMAAEVGAAPTATMMEMIYNMPEVFAQGIDVGLGFAFQQPHLLVNLLGERFMNEEVMGNTTFTGNAISFQKDKCAFIVFDENIKKNMEKEGGFDIINRVVPVSCLPDFGGAVAKAIQGGTRNIFVADSIAGLAEQTGIPADSLQRTVEEYNNYCDHGHDDAFNKRYDLLRPIRTPKFYAGRFYCSAYGTLGGIKINYKAEVQDGNWKSIPGLYAAGVDACTVYGDSYPFILPGNTMGFSINTGRIAGENAAEYVSANG
jgi:fumarate reductase flavoprotein subunit